MRKLIGVTVFSLGMIGAAAADQCLPNPQFGSDPTPGDVNKITNQLDGSPGQNYLGVPANIWVTQMRNPGRKAVCPSPPPS
jgi:hypothetical protein